MFNKVYEKVKNFIKNEWKFILIIIIFALVTNLRLPYIIEAPGGSINLDKRVVVENGHDAEGSFSMAYVTMIQGTPLSLLIASLRSSWDVTSYDDYTLDNEDYEDSLNRDKLYLQEALSNATIAAYKEADANINIKDAVNEVVYISKEAQTDLKLNDQILAVNGVKCLSLDEMREIIKEAKANDEVIFDIIRDGNEMTAKGMLYDTSEGVKVGIITITKYDYETDPELEIKFKESESGPSGGLMTALEIYNKLTEYDLTKGRKIIGTGTIDVNGNVGEIGGIKYKLAGAVKEHAEVFLCPLENLEEALQIKEKYKYKIEVKGVKDLKEAINYLKG